MQLHLINNMNEEALQYSYNLFSKDGYNGSIEDYKNLISTNGDALSYSYNLFSKDGYNGSENDFYNLISTKATEVETEPDPAVQETLTLEDWNLTEEDFIKDKSGKLARLYPEFKFEESGIDDQITVTNKRTGKSDYFDLGSTDLFKSDFEQFNDWIANEKSTMPELNQDEDYIYSRTGIIKTPEDERYKDELPARYEIKVEQPGGLAGERNVQEKELVTLINSIESIGKQVGLNPGLALPKFEGVNAEGFTGFTEDEAGDIKDYIYNQVVKQTNIPLTKDGFLKIYDTKLSANIEDQFKNIASANLQKQMQDNGMPEAASQLYVENKSRSIESNYTDKQKVLKNFNTQLSKTQDQLDILEANQSKTSEDNKRILRLKQSKASLQEKIKSLGGGVWSESGDWVNDLKLSDERKQNLKSIEEQSADLGSALNMFSIDQEDIDKLSTKDLTKMMLDQQMRESEYYTAQGNENKITINPNKLASTFTKGEAVTLLRASGLDVILKDIGNGYDIVYRESGEKVEEVAVPFQTVFDVGVRSEESGGYKGQLDFVFSGDGASRGLVSKDDLSKYRVWEENKLETEAELRGLYKLVNLGEDPSRVVKPTDYAERLGLYGENSPLNAIPMPGYQKGLITAGVEIAGWLETAGRGAGEETLRGWFGFNDEEIQKTLGQSKRNKLDEIRSTISLINNSNAVREGRAQPIKLSKEQEENFETSLAEMSAAGTGGFLPVLVEFALFEAATAGTPLGASRLARLPKVWQRLAAGAAKEELKMQASSADFGWGTGALFFGLGKAFEPIKFFKKHRVGLNNLTDKYVKAGPAGAMSIEASETIHAIVDDMMGNKDLGAAIEELYGDGSETFKRFMSNVIMFKMTGVQHFKWRDFQTSGFARREIKTLNDRFKNFIDQGRNLLNENNIASEPPKKIINEKEVPPTSGEKSLFVEGQLVELSKQNTEAGNNAKKILNNINKVSSTITTVHQMLAIRGQNNALDPYLKDPQTGDYVINAETGQKELNPKFQEEFNNFAMNPINDALKQAAPKDKNGQSTYKEPEVVFGSGKNDKGFRENFDKDANGKDMGDTANYDPNSNKVYLDIDLYEPGKPLHELTHVVFEAYFKGDPTNRTRFTEALRDMFKGVDFGTFKDSELKRSIEEAYNAKKYENIKAEEYIAMLSEFLSNPDVYYNNRELAGTLTGEIMSEIRLIKKKFGIGKNAKITTAADLVKVLGDLGMEMQRGYVSKTSAAQFAKLGQIDVQDLIMETTTIKENQKKVKVASKQINLSELSKSSAEKNAKNEEIISSIKERAERSGDPAYYHKTPQDILDLWENNRGLPRAVLESWQNETGFQFEKNPETGKLTEKGKLDKESVLTALDIKYLYRYAELYGNPNNLKPKTGETKEQFEKRKQQVENLDVPFFAYAAENLPKQMGNAIVEAGLGTRVGNKIIFKETIGGEAGELAMSMIADPNITEANIRSTERNIDFEEGRTDADGKALIEPISIIEPSKQKSTTESINERVTEIPGSYKATPDLSNVASEFGVRENRINNEDGTIRVGSFKFKDSEFKSAQDKFSEPGFLEKWYDIAIPEGQAGEGAREGVRGFDTGLQPVLKNILYEKTGTFEKTGPGKETRIKKPFSEVELPLQKLLGIEPGKDRVQNSKVNTALKNSIHQLGKAITNRTIRQREGLTPNEKENLASGKSRMVASKRIFIKELEKFKNITTRQRDRALSYLNKRQTNLVDLEDLSNMIKQSGMSEAGITEFINGFERIINDPANVSEVNREIEKVEAADKKILIEKYAKDFDVEIAEATVIFNNAEKNFSEMAKALNKKGIEIDYFKSYESNILSEEHFPKLKEAAEKLLENVNLDKLPDNILRAIKATLTANTNLKYPNGVKANPENVSGKGAKTSQYLRDLIKNQKLGTGSDASTNEFLNKTRYVHITSPGRSKKNSADITRKIDRNKEPDKWLEAQQEQYVNPELLKKVKQGEMSMQDAYELTMTHNENFKEFYFNALLEMSPNAAFALERGQVNSSMGIARGATPMEAISFRLEKDPSKKGTKEEDVELHNEHTKERTNEAKEALEVIFDKKLSKQQKKAKIKEIVTDGGQFLIDKNLQGVKDSDKYGGKVGRVSKSDAINTLVISGRAQDVVYLREPNAGKSASEVFTEQGGLEIAKKMLKDIPYENLKTADQVKAKQAIEYNKEKQQVFKDNIKEASEYDVYASKDISFEVLDNMSNRDKANQEARKTGRRPKKIRVFDFDDTLARSNNIVIAKKGGKEIKLNAEEFAKRGLQLKEQGWEMDFSDFNKVTEGSRGPLFKVAERIRDARGNEDLFVLTARAPESRDAIYEFLKAEGLEFKRENIIGLGNSTGEAKANWLTEKASEGYNDFYFADDAPQNVKAVRDALSVYDIKSKVQQAYASKKLKLSEDFNNILEQSTGIDAFKEYSAAKAKTVGANKGKFKFWIPYSAEDFQGLIYSTLSKGKVGDKQMAWYKENLLNPYARAMDNLSRDRVQLMSDFKALKKQLDVPKDLRKKNDSGFTNEQAVRVYLYNKMGYEVPGLSKRDLKELTDIVNSNGKLKAFADQILSVTKGDGYVKPDQNWLVGTITTDLIDLLNTTKRRKYLEEWQSNVDQIYSKENLNKLEAAYGPKYREALENVLTRMKSGRNRITTGNRLSNRMLDYINGSNAAIMFFNTRSAILQGISSINFINWSFNNPLRAGAAFANQPQYWRDFVKLMNSDFLLDRRNGLRLNIAESEIADAAATSKNKVKGAIKYILEKGYLPTQYMDSFAIASGGATWYRNRIKDLTKKGVNLTEAEAQALREWRQIAEESQQSSDPSRISQQQASDAGRLILMFANTPMQYARLQKRAFQDLVNRRGDAKTNMSKIVYYSFVQSIIFNALQQALFKIGFDDEVDDEEKNKTYFRTANGMLDSQLRGLGIGGAALSVVKNFLLDVYERSGRKRPEYVDAVYKLLQFSPPISSKISKIRQAAYTFDSKKRRQEIFDKGFSLDNPALMAGAKVVSATTNIPLDRVLQKYDNIDGALSEEAELWQSTSMMGGWPRWSIMPDRDEYVTRPKSKEEKLEIKLQRDNQRYEAATGSTDFETIKKLNRKQQMEMIKSMKVSRREMSKLKNAKEAELINWIIKNNKEQ